ncbi:ATP-binding cassette domain-containing protein [Streptomyces sp. NPDC002825]|uniref:ATP-binding cassette domain-containing protein n=1 Tax=Streptomyces sp. NPDC002825 TaxID=3154666 RepID=UPI003318FA65
MTVSTAPGAASEAVPETSDWAAYRHALRPLLIALGASPEALPAEPPPGADPVALAVARCGVRAQRAPLAEALTWRPGNPVLALRGDLPVALLPAPRGRRLLQAPGHGAPRPLTRADVAGCAETAWVLHRRLPLAGSVRGRLLRHALHGAGPAVAATVTTGLLAAVAAFAVPIGSLLLLTAVLGGDDALFGWACAAVATAVPLGWLLGELRDRASARLQTSAQGAVEPAVWDHVLRLPLPFLRGYPPARLLHHAGGVGRLRGLLGASGLDALLGAVFSAVGVGLLMAVDVVLGLAAVVVSLLLLALVAWLSWRQQKHDLRVYDAVEDVQAAMYPALLGIEEVRAYGAGDLVVRRWQRVFDEQKRADEAGLRYAEAAAGMIAATLPLMLAVLLPVALWRQAGAHGLWASSFAAVQLNLALGRLPSILQAAFSVRTTHARLVPLLTAAPESGTGSGLSRPLSEPLSGRFELRRVTFGYEDGAAPVLNGLDLAVGPGEFLAVVGESGAGKSTLLRLLLGLDAPGSGSVLFDGRDLRELDLDSVRRQIGYVPQDTKVLRGDVRSVILGTHAGTGAGFGDAEVWRAARLAGIATDIAALPMGLDTRLTDGHTGLSGGQLQRLLIARALVGAPGLLLLDEATSALDSATQDGISEAIGALGITRVVVAHRLSTIRRADRIVVVADGRVAESGDFDSLLAAGGRFARLVADSLT